MMVDKLEFYKKLEKKLLKIKSGELGLNDYHREVVDKIIKLQN